MSTAAEKRQDAADQRQDAADARTASARAKASKFQPQEWPAAHAERLARLTPEQRAAEQAAWDAMTPEQRERERVRWNNLTPEQQAHESAGGHHLEWVGPGVYVLQSQVRLDHPTAAERYAALGYTPEQVAADQERVAKANAAAAEKSAKERTDLDKARSARAGKNPTKEQQDKAAAEQHRNLSA